MKSSLFYFLTLLTVLSFGQNKYPENYFRSPLDIPIILSGTFGELRSNHFHAGLDIKTQRKNGLAVYAAADGYVSRIKVSLWGYGKALYIRHPNGFTTVYAHLSKYGKGIEEYVKKIQYQKENYETGNIYLKPDVLKVKKGQVVALSGDTGGYVAPHLHFEIRDTKTEHIINPMFFGYLPKDSKAPTFNKLMGYPLDNHSRINKSNKQVVIPIRNLGNGKYITNRITASGKIGFGVNVFDRLDAALNKNGIYSLEMLVNGKKVYHHDLETFSFAESKLINLLIDYPHFAKYKNRVQKTHRVAANTLSIYDNLIKDGVINVEKGFNYTIEIIASDFKGNKSSIKIPVRGEESNSLFSAIKDTTAYKIVAKKYNKFTRDGVTIIFPKNTFYEDVYLDFKTQNGIASIHTPTIPLDKRYTLSFDTSKFNNKEKQQSYIANINNKKYPRYQKTVKKEDKFYTTTKTLGNYTLKRDSIKPKIQLVNFTNEQWLSKHNYLKVKIYDNESGIKSYKAYIDNEWVLMEYNLKKKLLTYNFKDKPLIGAKHHFKIMVSDNVGNTNTLSTTFYKK